MLSLTLRSHYNFTMLMTISYWRLKALSPTNWCLLQSSAHYKHTPFVVCFCYTVKSVLVLKKMDKRAFFFNVFFNPKLKQTKVRRVELNRLNDKKKKRHTHLCFHYKKSVKRDKKNKTKQNKTNIVTNIQWTFLQWEIYRCHVMENVDAILQVRWTKLTKNQHNHFS